MKFSFIALATVLLVSSLAAQEKSTQLKDQKDKVSYSIGLNIGFNFAKQKIPVNPDALVAGVRDALNGKPQMTEPEVKQTMTAFEKDMMDKQKVDAAKNATEGAKFLEDNKKKDGVKTTASGLQYKSIKEGTGPQPQASDTVTVNYRGTLIDGTEFDSSYKRGEPATFPLGNVIKGWTEGVQLMKKGSKYQFVIPANLAYGERSPGANVPPNSTLIFEVELMDFKSSGDEGASPSPATK